MTVRFAAVAAGMVMAVSSVAQAQDAASAKLDVELNALAPSQKGCMMTFVAENNLQAPINKISFELAFFNDKNAVDRITVLDFRDLPQGKKRVRQFDMPNVKCETVTRIIINDTPVCDGPAAGECMKGLVTRSQISVPFEG
ncbi:hypothetical protein [Rhizobium chutanense]|uniref:Tat pathway signal sequence domain protein n=1 Tax=Rhizobium chutanense TaxID=2035448 RepID=A0A3S0QIF7_9HYPH|nr:hypothetical protein [Rhizobium chutanense]RUM07654.1 hypothetical protein EFR84_08465 [Rhizobium chutanense]